MLKAKHFFALVAVAAALVLFAANTLKEGDPIPQSGDLVFPDLLQQIPEVAKVEVVSEGQKFTLEHAGEGRWVAPARNGFALDANKMHQLLVGAAGLRRIEPKTANPELYPMLGVEDPSAPESASIGYTLHSGSGQVMAGLIVGEGNPAKGDPAATEYFVRAPGEAQSWLVKGALPDGVDSLQDWLVALVAGIDVARIEQVQVTHPDAEVVTVRKPSPGGGEFQYVEEPAGIKVKDVWRLNDMGRVLVDLELEDVKTAAQASSSFRDDARKVEMRTYDGLVVNMQVVKAGEDEHLARLSASFDEAAAKVGAELGSKELMQPDAVKDEVTALNARWAPWVYVIPRYKSDYVNKRQADLLPDPEPEQKKAPGS